MTPNAGNCLTHRLTSRCALKQHPPSRAPHRHAACKRCSIPSLLLLRFQVITADSNHIGHRRHHDVVSKEELVVTAKRANQSSRSVLRQVHSLLRSELATEWFRVVNRGVNITNTVTSCSLVCTFIIQTERVVPSDSLALNCKR